MFDHALSYTIYQDDFCHRCAKETLGLDPDADNVGRACSDQKYLLRYKNAKAYGRLVQACRGPENSIKSTWKTLGKRQEHRHMR